LTATNDGPTVLGRTTTLTATISAGTDVVYTWSFGDGSGGRGAVVTYTYRATGAHTAVVTAANGTNVVTATTGVTVTPQVIEYAYDPLGRLTEATYASGERYAYRYDAHATVSVAREPQADDGDDGPRRHQRHHLHLRRRAFAAVGRRSRPNWGLFKAFGCCINRGRMPCFREWGSSGLSRAFSR
jgi:YD repeat-containing protein